MTDEPVSATPEPKLEPTEEGPLGEPTPEERLAEIEPDDPEVGSDGTGLGELP